MPQGTNPAPIAIFQVGFERPLHQYGLSQTVADYVGGMPPPFCTKYSATNMGTANSCGSCCSVNSSLAAPVTHNLSWLLHVGRIQQILRCHGGSVPLPTSMNSVAGVQMVLGGGRFPNPPQMQFACLAHHLPSLTCQRMCQLSVPCVLPGTCPS